MSEPPDAGAGRRLILRRDVRLGPVGLEHAPTMFRWACQAEVRMNLGLRREPSEVATREWLSNALSSRSILPFTVWIGAEHVGMVVLDELDHWASSGRFSVYLGKARGRGAGRTAVYLAMEEGFTRHGLNKVWSLVHCRNADSLRMVQRLGFTVEGRLREVFVLETERIDAYYVGLLRRDFERLQVEWADGAAT